MPLIILGLIVVLCGALLIYYQLGPKVTLRLKSGFGGGGPAADEAQGEGGAESEIGPDSAKAEEKPKDDEKILYVFGRGESEERSLHEDSGQDSDK